MGNKNSNLPTANVSLYDMQHAKAASLIDAGQNKPCG
jgi:hypothetical protein